MDGIADYRFDRSLWSGNHGTFWRARTPSRLGIDDEFVAVKVLDHHATDADFKRMANELRIFAAVESPHLVALFDAGHQGGRLYYSSEYVTGGSLAAPAGELSSWGAIGAIADASSAANALHEAGVAHRDIKPSNILLDAQGRGRLADLGLAQILNPGQTITGVGPLGAVEFVAPETIRGERAGRASDIWALGASLHRALTGCSLYPQLPGDSLLEALRHVLTTPPVVDPGVQPELGDLIQNCCAALPADRPRTAADLHDMLRSLLEGEDATDA